MKNKIVQNQRSESAVEYACAFRWAYSNAKRWKSIIWMFTLVLAVLQIVVTSRSALFTYVVQHNLEVIMISILLLTLLLQVFGKTFGLELWQKRGSLAQQFHDNSVLGLRIKPNFLSLTPSLIKKYADNYKAKRPSDMENLSAWWPEHIDVLPYHAAIIICQLSTFKWEFELRRKYQRLLVFILIVTMALIFITAWLNSYTIEKIILFLLVPATPFLALLLDELLINGQFYKQALHTANISENLWMHVVEHKVKDEHGLIDKLSGIQSDWQQYRRSASPIFDWLYWISRKSMEIDMLVDSRALANEYRMSFSTS